MTDLIERYLYAVGKGLSKGQREEVLPELRAAILDTLEEGGDYTEQDVLEVLRTFGPPREVAAGYRPEGRYVIGPALYGTYRMVLGIVLLAVALGLTIATLVGTLAGEASLLTFVPRLMGNLLSASFGAVGSVTVIFWLIERYVPEVTEDWREEETFDPKKLDSVPPSPDRVSTAELVAENVFLFIAWTVLTFYPDWIAVISVQHPVVSRIPLFHTEALRPYVTVFTFLWFFQFLLNLYLLKKGRRTVTTRMLEIIFSLGGLAIFLVAAGDPSLINREALSVLPDSLMSLAGTGGRLLVLFIVVLTLIEVGKHVYQIIKAR